MKKGGKNKQYYRVEKSGDIPQIFLYSYIGDKDWWDDDYDYTDETITKEIEDLAKTNSEIHIRINSNGGSTKHGAAIITTIRKHRNIVHTFNDGVAYSIAAEILFAPAKENIHIADNSVAMIHSASGWNYGNAKTMREYAEYLDTVTNSNARMLSKKFDMSEDEFIAEYYDGSDHFLGVKELEELGFTIEDYEAEGMPSDINKRDYNAVQAFFDEMENPKKGKKSIFKFLNINKKQEAPKGTNVPPVPPASNENELDMADLDSLRKALGSGDLDLEALKKVIQEEEAKKPATTADVKKLIEDKFNAKFDELKALLKPEEKKEGDTPETPETPELTETEKKIQDLESQLEALKKSDGGTFTQPSGGGKQGDEPKKLQPWEDPKHPMNSYALEKGAKWEKPAEN